MAPVRWSAWMRGIIEFEQHCDAKRCSDGLNEVESRDGRNTLVPQPKQRGPRKRDFLFRVRLNGDHDSAAQGCTNHADPRTPRLPTRLYSVFALYVTKYLTVR